MTRPPRSHLRHSPFVILSSFGFLVSSFSCVAQPKHDGMTPTQAQAVAIRAVRTAERDSRLDVDVFDTQQTPAGDYAVYLQRHTTSVTADHWRVLVRSDGYAEVVPAEPAETSPALFRAYPRPLSGDSRDVGPPAPEPLITGPRE